MTNTNDIAIPEIKLIQNVGGDEAKSQGAKPGQFYCAITGEIMDYFALVIAQPPSKNRTYWGRETMEDEPPVCASLDGITSINGDTCAENCPYKAYNDAPYMLKASERRMKCTPNYNILGIQLPSLMPVVIRCTGISAQAAKELNSLLLFHKDLRGGQTFKAYLTVQSVTKKTESGEAFAIKFGQPQLIQDQNTLTDVKEVFKSLADANLAQISMGDDIVEQKAIPESTQQPPSAEKQVTKPDVSDDVDNLFGKDKPPVGFTPPPGQEPKAGATKPPEKKPLPKMNF